MAVGCERCGKKLEEKQGFLDSIGFGSYEGYECTECGAILCQECYQKRQRERPGNYDTCPVCGGILESR